MSLPMSLYEEPEVPKEVRPSLPIFLDHSGKGGGEEDEEEEDEDEDYELVRSASLPATWVKAKRKLLRTGSLPDPKGLRLLDRSRLKRDVKIPPRLLLETGKPPRLGSLPAHLQELIKKEAQRGGSLPGYGNLMLLDRSGGRGEAIPEDEEIMYELSERGYSLPPGDLWEEDDEEEEEDDSDVEWEEFEVDDGKGGKMRCRRRKRRPCRGSQDVGVGRGRKKRGKGAKGGKKKKGKKIKKDLMARAADLMARIRAGEFNKEYDPALRGVSLPEPMYSMGTIGPRGSWLHKQQPFELREGKPHPVVTEDAEFR